jgi:dynein heavy chain
LTTTNLSLEKSLVNNQDKIRLNIETAIQKFSQDSRDEFRNGIKRILDDLKETITKENENEDSHIKKEGGLGQDDEGNDDKVRSKTSEADKVFEDLGFKPNLKYGPKSKLRKECSRFLRFAYLLDFVTMEALSNVYLNSVQ